MNENKKKLIIEILKKLLSRVAPKASKIRARLLFNIAVLENVDGNEDLSITYITKAIKADPTLPVLFFQRAVFYHKLGKLQEAMIDYSETLRV